MSADADFVREEDVLLFGERVARCLALRRIVRWIANVLENSA